MLTTKNALLKWIEKQPEKDKKFRIFYSLKELFITNGVGVQKIDEKLVARLQVEGIVFPFITYGIDVDKLKEKEAMKASS